MSQIEPLGEATTRDLPVRLGDYLTVVRRRWLLISAMTAVLGGLALLVTSMETPIYEAVSEVLVTPVTGNPFIQPARVDQIVTLDTERQVAGSLAVARLAARELGTTLSPRELLRNLSVTTPSNSEVLAIAYSSPNPTFAARAADVFADSYLRFKREQVLGTSLALSRSIQARITDLEKQVRDTDRIVATTRVGSPEHTTASDQREILSGQIGTLRAQQAMIATVDLNPGQVIEPATVPTSPSSPRVAVNLGLGLFLGIFLGTVLAFARDRLDDRVRATSEVEAALEAPVLAIVPKHARWKSRSKNELTTLVEPTGREAEGYRALRTTLLAMGAKRGLRAVLVVSPEPRDGKSVTSANLSVVLAEAGKKVILVSADLRAPRAHELFELKPSPGLSQVLSGEVSAVEAMQNGFTNLSVLTSGPATLQHVDLLGGAAMGDLLDELTGLADFVVIDSAPILAVADSLGLARSAQQVLFAVTLGQTSFESLREAKQQLVRVGAEAIGAVVYAPGRSLKTYGYGYGAGPNNRVPRNKGRRRRPMSNPPRPRVGVGEHV